MNGTCTCCRLLDAVPGSPWCDHCLANAIDLDGHDPAPELVPDEPWQPVNADAI